MGTSIQSFCFRDNNDVRVHLDDQGDPWLVAKDVCNILGLEQTTRALSRLDESEKGITICNTLGGNQTVNTVSESGLYALIFTSRKKEAKSFRLFVTQDILPTLRKTGTYSVSAVNPDAITRTQLAQMVIDSEKAREALEGQVKKLQPAADYAMNVLNEHPGASMLIGTFAKSFDCGLGPLQIFRWLRDTGIFFIRNNENLPKQEYIDRGYFALKQQVIPTKKDGIVKDRHVCTVLITTKGQIWLSTKLRLAGYTKHQAALALN